MSVKFSTLVAGMLLDRKTKVIYVDDADSIIGADFLQNHVSNSRKQQRAVVVYHDGVKTSGIGIINQPLAIKGQMLYAGDYAEVLPYENIYSKISGKCKSYHSMLSTAIESGNIEMIDAVQRINKSTNDVFRELQRSGLTDKVFINTACDANNLVMLECDLGMVGLERGEFVLIE